MSTLWRRQGASMFAAPTHKARHSPEMGTGWQPDACGMEEDSHRAAWRAYSVTHARAHTINATMLRGIRAIRHRVSLQNAKSPHPTSTRCPQVRSPTLCANEKLGCHRGHRQCASARIACPHCAREGFGSPWPANAPLGPSYRPFRTTANKHSSPLARPCQRPFSSAPRFDSPPRQAQNNHTKNNLGCNRAVLHRFMSLVHLGGGIRPNPTWNRDNNDSVLSRTPTWRSPGQTTTPEAD